MELFQVRYGELTDDVHQRQVMESFQRLYEQLGTYRLASRELNITNLPLNNFLKSAEMLTN